MNTTTDEPTTIERACVLGLDPDKKARVPKAEDFPEGDEFFDDPVLTRFVHAVADKHGLGEDRYTLAVRWKKTGGDVGGKETFGRCVKLSGHARHFAEVDFLIWLAADRVADYGLTNWQLEALAFHELLHAITDGKGKPAIRPHDAEVFADEFRAYGAWMLDLEYVASAVRQMPLFGEAR